MGAEVGPAWGSDLLHKPKDLRVPLKGTGKGENSEHRPGSQKGRIPSPSSCGILDNTPPRTRPQFPQLRKTSKPGDDFLSHQWLFKRM